MLLSRLFALMLIPIVGISLPSPAAAVAPDYSTSASLGDGVDGLDPNRSTPIESQVWAIESVDSLMLVGGAFLEVRDRSSYDRIPRPYLAAFDPTTGEYVPWFRTQVDGPVYDIVDLGNGRAVIAGEFSTVNGVAGTSGVAIIDMATGLVDTNYSISVGNSGVVRAVAIHGDWLYVAGSFTELSAGGSSISAGGLGRLSLATGQLDTSWAPTVQGGGVWGIGVAGNGRVFIGGYFLTVNGVDGTETLAALEPSNGSLVAGWNHGFPHEVCNINWRITCGAVNGLVVTNNRVFVAGAKHYWAALSTGNGAILADREVTNDAQSVDLVDGMVVIGCHCETSTTSDEFNNIAHRYLRVIDPATLHEVESPTVNSRGAAGGWAADEAPDGCFWGGGNFSSTTSAGGSKPAWNLLRFCPAAGAGTNPSLLADQSVDQTPPTVPSAPSIESVDGASVTLNWAGASDDSGQVAYIIFRNGQAVGRTSTPVYQDRLLGYNATYTWRVAAVDMAGNMSQPTGRSSPVRIGPAINIALTSTSSQSNDFSPSTQSDKAIDGNTNGNPAANSISRTGFPGMGLDSWWNIDLGQVTYVDRVVLHPRRDAQFRESNNRPRFYYSNQPVTAQSIPQANTQGLTAWVGDVSRPGATPRIDTVEVSDQLRYLRIFLSSGRASFAEVQVWTTNPQPTPNLPATDTTNPSSPSWKQTRNRGNNTVLSWGRGSDDRGVAYYEVYDGGQMVTRTTDRWASVGNPGLPASRFSVISFDAAGNASSDIPDPAGDPVTSCSSSVAGNTILVSWTGAQAASRFVIKRTRNGSQPFWRGTVDSPATSFSDTNRSGTLIYSVEARYGAAHTSPTICTNDAGADPVPSGLSATRVEKRKVVLHYGGLGDPVEIERDGVVVATDGDDWHTDANLNPGTTYTYRVRFAGLTAWSDPISITTLSAPRNEAPASCQWTPAGSSISVTWTGAVAADAVVVARQINGGQFWWRGRQNAPATSFVDTNHSGNINYRVKAKYGNNSSTWTYCQ